MLTLTLINGVAYGSLLFLMAAGFTLIFGVLRVINMAHGSLYLLGAHIAISTVQYGWGIVAGVLAGSLSAAALGALAEKTILHRLQGDYLAQVLVTFGIYLIIGDLALATWGGTPRILTLPPELNLSVNMGDTLRYPVDRLVLIVLAPVLAAILWLVIDRTRLGASIRAAVDDEEIAKSTGIVVPHLRIIVFGVGSLLAGFSGALGSSFVGAKPGLDMEVMLLALVIVVVGGSGSLIGSFIAALGTGLIDSVGKTFFPEASLFLLFAPMLVVLLVRPRGLFGRAGQGQPHRPRPRPIVIPLPGLLVRMRASFGRHAGYVAVGLGLVSLTILVAAPVLFSGYVVNILTLSLIWVLFASGLNVMLGYGGMPSLGHALFFGAGAYTVAWSHFAGLPGLAACGLAILAGLGAGVVLAITSLRSRQEQLLLVTLAFAQVIWGIVFKWRSVTNGDDGLTHAQSLPSIGGLGYSTAMYFAVLLIVGLGFVSYVLFVDLRVGLVVKAMRTNEARLEAFGYNSTAYRFTAYLVSGALSGLAGGLFAIYTGFVSPDLFGVVVSAKVLLMVTIGSAGTLLGPALGAFGIVGVEEILSGWTERWHSLLGLVYMLVAFVAFAGVRFGTRPIVTSLPSGSERR